MRYPSAVCSGPVYEGGQKLVVTDLYTVAIADFTCLLMLDSSSVYDYGVVSRKNLQGILLVAPPDFRMDPRNIPFRQNKLAIGRSPDAAAGSSEHTGILEPCRNGLRTFD